MVDTEIHLNAERNKHWDCFCLSLLKLLLSDYFSLLKVGTEKTSPASELSRVKETICDATLWRPSETVWAGGGVWGKVKAEQDQRSTEAAKCRSAASIKTKPQWHYRFQGEPTRWNRSTRTQRTGSAENGEMGSFAASWPTLSVQIHQHSLKFEQTPGGGGRLLFYPIWGTVSCIMRWRLVGWFVHEKKGSETINKTKIKVVLCAPHLCLIHNKTQHISLFVNWTEIHFCVWILLDKTNMNPQILPGFKRFTKISIQLSIQNI